MAYSKYLTVGHGPPSQALAFLVGAARAIDLEMIQLFTSAAHIHWFKPEM